MENPIKMDDFGVPLFLETPNWVLQGCEMFKVIHPKIHNREMGKFRLALEVSL